MHRYIKNKDYIERAMKGVVKNIQKTTKLFNIE